MNIRKINGLIIAFAGHIICMVFSTGVMAQDNRPNIIIIYVDDMGYNDLSSYGPDSFEIRTPNIDSIGQRGIMFTNGYTTASQCVPSRTGMVTGRYQQRYGMEVNQWDPGWGLDANAVTVASRMKDLGYVTAHAGKWHVGMHQTNTLPDDFGFDHISFDSPYIDAAEARLAEERGIPGFKFDLAQDWEYGTKQSLYITEQSKSVIDRFHDQPLFMYVAYYAPHSDFHSTRDYFNKNSHIVNDSSRQEYAGMISELDDCIGDLIKKLREYNLEENTIIFFSSDNGQQQTVDLYPFTHNSNDPWRGKKGIYYEGGIRVPYMVQWKGTIEPGQISDYPVSTLDMGASSVAAAGGFDASLYCPPPAVNMEGLNMLPFYKNKYSLPPDDRILYWRWQGQMAARQGRWKIVRSVRESSLEPIPVFTKYPTILKFQLFDMEGTGRLEDDYMDMAFQYPEIVDSLSKCLMHWNDELVRPRWANENDESNYLHMYPETGTKEYVPLNSNGDTPAPPLEVNYRDASGAVRISWSPSSYANGYILEESTDSVSWERITTSDQFTFTKLDEDPLEGLRYYRAKAYNAAGYSMSVPAIELDIADLQNSINVAQENLDAATIGNMKGEYTQKVTDIVTNAISEAQNAMDEALLQSEVDAAVSTLEAEMAKFVPNARDDMDLTALQDALADAQQKVDTATVGNGVGEYTQEVMDLALSAILTAQNVLDTVTLQSVVDAALATLVDEMAGFVSNTTWIDQRNLSEFKVYPNPVREELFISTNSYLSYCISDSSGRILLNKKSTGNRIDVSALQDGIYFLRIEMYHYALQTIRFVKMQ